MKNVSGSMEQKLAKKEYDRKYRLARRLIDKDYDKRQYWKHRLAKLINSKKYRKENCRVGDSVYAGVVDACPRCGKKGYKRYQRFVNIRTGTLSNWATHVRHQHGECVDGKRKTIHDGVCYIGMGKL